MDLITISAVSYLNTLPFIYGIEKSGILKNYKLELDMPAVCAEKIVRNKVDISLAPVGIIPLLEKPVILTDYCIGSVGKVGSVMLYSDVPVPSIEQILLDYQSKTSIALVQILAAKYWKIYPQWIKATAGFESEIMNRTAGIVIGDRTFKLRGKYNYAYDLAEEWNKFTGLPFVFACWITTRSLPETVKDTFSEAIRYGITEKSRLLSDPALSEKYGINVTDYLNNSISYTLDERKREAMDLFLSYFNVLKQD